MDKKVRERLKKIRLVALDVDGVLTDGQLYFSENGGVYWKAFHVRDGLGFQLGKTAGLSFCFLTGRKFPGLYERAKALGVEFVIENTWNKRKPFRELKKKYGWKEEEIAYIGDDLNDLPVFEEVNVRVAVANAVKEVKKQADLVLKAKGGEGALREFVELVLKAQKRWEQVLKDFSAWLQAE
ncbi:MAG: KdsC family phosphatase [bacterium]